MEEEVIQAEVNENFDKELIIGENNTQWNDANRTEMANKGGKDKLTYKRIY